MTHYALTLADEGRHGLPPELRLRRALKVLLRSFGLRAVDVRVMPAGCEGNGAESLGKGGAKRSDRGDLRTLTTLNLAAPNSCEGASEPTKDPGGSPVPRAKKIAKLSLEGRQGPSGKRREKYSSTRTFFRDFHHHQTAGAARQG
jgi:hypothetical protein